MLKIIRKIFNSYELGDVFTPTSTAKMTYVQRDEIESDLIKYINLRGMQVVVYGNSGSGKTTLVTKILNSLHSNYIITRCTKETSFTSMIKDVFDQLDMYYTSGYNETFQAENENGLSGKGKVIQISNKRRKIWNRNIQLKRSIDMQLTPQRLAESLGEREIIWVIEDFHKVEDVEKTKLSQILKVFMDTANQYRYLKIVCIGAVATARELIQYDPDLSNRVGELYVPLLTDVELKKIVNTGFTYMNIEEDNSEVIENIVRYSNRLASVCHYICYEICFCKGIRKKSKNRIIVKDEDIKLAVKAYIRFSSDTFNKHYERATALPEGKNLFIEYIENESENISVNSYDDKSTRDIKINICKKLCSNEYGEVLRYNSDAEHYSFSNPFFEAYLKMKISLEKAEEEKRNSRRRSNKIYKPKPKELIINEDFIDAILNITYKDLAIENNFVEKSDYKFRPFDEKYYDNKVSYKNKIIEEKKRFK